MCSISGLSAVSMGCLICEMLEWINTKWSIPVMEHYSATKKKEAPTAGMTWMNPEKGILRGSSQTQKDEYCMIPFIGNVQSR